MKKAISIVILAVMLALTACGQANPAAEASQSTGGEAVQIANPWREVTEAEAKELVQSSLGVPAGAESVRWSVMESEPALIELSFVLDGMEYTARAQATADSSADCSGMYYEWTAQDELTLEHWGNESITGTYNRFIGEDESADLCTWYDASAGIAYSLSVTAKDLDGFDLQAIAEALYAPEQMTAQTQADDSQAAASAQTETSSEPESIRIEVAWESEEELDVSLKGSTEDGKEIQITKDDTEVHSENGELIAKVQSETEQSEHHVTFVLYKLDAHLELEAVNGPENRMPESIQADVYLSGSESPVHFDNQDAAGTYRSYTGVWFWAPFGLDHGELVDYDASWIEEGASSQE